MHCHECALRKATYLLSSSHFTAQQVQVLYNTYTEGAYNCMFNYNTLVYSLSQMYSCSGSQLDTVTPGVHLILFCYSLYLAQQDHIQKERLFTRVGVMKCSSEKFGPGSSTAISSTAILSTAVLSTLD